MCLGTTAPMTLEEGEHELDPPGQGWVGHLHQPSARDTYIINALSKHNGLHIV